MECVKEHSIRHGTEYIIEPERSTRADRRVDVLVVGGGVAGCSAAVAAARTGASVLILERYGFFGGIATAALVGCFCGVYTCGPDSTHQMLVGGNAHHVMNVLSERGYGFKYRHRFQVDHEIFKSILDEWVTGAGVEPFFYVQAVGALTDGSGITGVLVEHKAGREAISASVVIDASGDGDVAAMAGAPFEKGDAQGRLQAPTMVFYMGNVDVDLAVQFPESEIRALLTRVIADGEFSFKRVSGSFSPAGQPGKVHVNMSRVTGVDGTDPVSTTFGHIEGRRQVLDYARFLKKYIPGFEKAHIDAIPAQLGIRETRRITGDYVLTGQDVLSARKFEDAIGRSSWPIEDHSVGEDTIRLHLPGDEFYQIPYRCLLPRGVENLLVAGRCISSTHEAQASVRVMGPAMVTGEAAGVAAALAVKHGVTPRRLDVAEIRDVLLKNGALI